MRRRIQLWLTIVWLIIAVPGVVWWRNSVPFLVFISIWANVAGHWSAYEAASPTEGESTVASDDPPTMG